jgi:ElaB/YqjD/DUF883 family membrane-anchored ribosome-binding protein
MGNERELSDHFDAIRDDIAALTERVSQLVSDTAGIQASVRKRVTALSSDAFQSAAKQANAAVSSVGAGISRSPLGAVLIALGAGFAIGLVSRK